MLLQECHGNVVGNEKVQGINPGLSLVAGTGFEPMTSGL